MSAGLKLLAGPVLPAVLVAELMAFLRLEDDEEQPLLEQLLQSATLAVEQYCRRALMAQHYLYSLSHWPDGAVRLPRPPLRQVLQLSLSDDGEIFTPVAVDRYLVDTVAEPGLLIPKANLWPNPSGGIRIEYECGYGDDWNAVPQDLRQAVMSTAAHWFQRREAGSGLGPGVAELIGGYRIVGL